MLKLSKIESFSQEHFTNFTNIMLDTIDTNK